MAAGPLVQIGQDNTYVKDHASSGRLTIEYSRNPKEFALPNYIQIRPVQKQSGYYLKIDQRQAGRLVGGELTDYVWPDGHPRPKTRQNGMEFNFHDFFCIRRNFGQPIGDLAREQADFGVEDTQEGIQAQQAMTGRTLLVQQALDLSANWDAAHYMNVTSIPGVTGTWDTALSTNLFIKKSLNYGSKRILKSTLGKVRKKDLILVMNPTTAMAISETQELVDQIKQSQEAYGQVVQAEGRWSEWGIPDRLYGIKVVVEDSVMVTSPKGAATQTEEFVMADGIAYLLSRPGGLMAKGGGPSFSTATLFAKEEMTVQRKHDEYNRLLDLDVVDHVGVGLTSTAAGFAFRAVL
ncbi:hypothetical protein [Aureliella helgolandensis]|uniref:Uncharacterized protein n=1 Tax=Aureliella helgolandensis TaxID=2527968 RepID=A0A518GCS0_9BACT|nr:hypothetical protein [Aureliella helgolandensis]QDV26347.1 hypothetical protein Q31a_47200 [Aureliella helgolandensis]